jgi:hypothetical protein
LRNVTLDFIKKNGFRLDFLKKWRFHWFFKKLFFFWNFLPEVANLSENSHMLFSVVFGCFQRIAFPPARFK